MGMRARRNIHLIHISLILSVGIVPSCQPQELTIKKKKQILRESVKKRRKESNGTIKIKGKVCDSKGNLLNNVKIKGHKSKYLGFWGKHKDKDVSDKVSGHFSFTFKDCSTVGLDFIKDGYRRAHISAPGKSGPGETDFPHKMEDVKVVLYKRGDLTLLKDYGGTLRYNADGSGTVIVIDPNKDPRKEKPTKQVENIHNPEAIPKPSVYMRPATTEKGKIDTVRIEELKEHTNTAVYPKKIRLITKGKKGGFIKFTPKEDVPIAVQMTEAPKEGYKKELVLSLANCDERIQALREKYSKEFVLVPKLETLADHPYGRQGKTWFYIQVGDLYGKGYCGALSSSDPAEEIKLEVHLYLQLDGTRNVETKRAAPY